MTATNADAAMQLALQIVDRSLDEARLPERHARLFHARRKRLLKILHGALDRTRKPYACRR